MYVKQRNLQTLVLQVLMMPRILSLEQALDFIDTDELLEITPKNIRIRKKILDPTARYRAKRNGKA